MKLKKILALMCCAVLLVCISVGATVAYLTSTTKVVNNTFTVGSVSITLDEYKSDLYGEATTGEARVMQNTYKLIPGHNYDKDPTVHVAKGSEPAWLFVKVENGLANAEADTTIAAQMTANGWALVSGQTNVYAYKEIVDARNANIDKVVFKEFTLKNDVDVTAYADKAITIQAYAVQADSFATAADAWKAAPANWNAAQ